MKFSIIIPIFNVKKYLKNCLESVVNQTFKNYEVIMVVDKCDDGSEKIADEYINKYNWIKIYEERTGLSKARNLGIKKAKGDYLVFLDGDDYLEKDFLETINNSLNEKPDVLRFQIRDILDKEKVDHKEKGFDVQKGTLAFDKIVRYH